MGFSPCDQGHLDMEETLWLETGVLWFSASRCLEFHICTPQPCLLCLRTDVLVEGPLYVFFIKIVLLYLSVCLGCCACTHGVHIAEDNCGSWFSPTMRFQRLSSGPQAWQQGPLLMRSFLASISSCTCPLGQDDLRISYELVDCNLSWLRWSVGTLHS